MFVTEASQGAVAAVWEGKMRLVDGPPFIAVWSAVHPRYEGFTEGAVRGIVQGLQWAAILTETRGKCESSEAVDISGPRIALRVMGELWLVGSMGNASFFMSLLQTFLDAMRGTSKGGNIPAHPTANILTSTSVMARQIGIVLSGGSMRGFDAATLTLTEHGAGPLKADAELSARCAARLADVRNTRGKYAATAEPADFVKGDA